MTKRIIVLTAVGLAAAVLAAPAAAQTTTATATVVSTINWEVVPGALYRTYTPSTGTSGLGLSVGCKLTSRDANFAGRNSLVLMQLKLQRPDPAAPNGWKSLYGSRGYPNPITGGGAKYCDLQQGVHSVSWNGIELFDGTVAVAPTAALVESLRVVIRYYSSLRYPQHAGLNLANGQFYHFTGNGFIDLVNNGPSPAAEAEDIAEFGYR